MNNVSKKIFLVLASAALLFAGCSKKPVRPTPDQTRIGNGANDPTLTSTNIDTNAELPGRGGVDPTAVDKTKLEPVYFDFNESSIKPAERAKLQKAKAYLESNPGTRLVLEGHCDWRGTEEYNLGLGDRRANAVKKYLGTIGVGADKLETLSKGSLDATKNADESTASKERRVDLGVTGGK